MAYTAVRRALTGAEREAAEPSSRTSPGCARWPSATTATTSRFTLAPERRRTQEEADGATSAGPLRFELLSDGGRSYVQGRAVTEPAVAPPDVELDRLRSGLRLRSMSGAECYAHIARARRRVRAGLPSRTDPAPGRIRRAPRGARRAVAARGHGRLTGRLHPPPELPGRGHPRLARPGPRVRHGRRSGHHRRRARGDFCPVRARPARRPRALRPDDVRMGAPGSGTAGRRRGPGARHRPHRRAGPRLRNPARTRLPGARSTRGPSHPRITAAHPVARVGAEAFRRGVPADPGRRGARLRLRSPAGCGTSGPPPPSPDDRPSAGRLDPGNSRPYTRSIRGSRTPGCRRPHRAGRLGRPGRGRATT